MVYVQQTVLWELWEGNRYLKNTLIVIKNSTASYEIDKIRLFVYGFP